MDRSICGGLPSRISTQLKQLPEGLHSEGGRGSGGRKSSCAGVQKSQRAGVKGDGSEGGREKLRELMRLNEQVDGVILMEGMREGHPRFALSG